MRGKVITLVLLGLLVGGGLTSAALHGTGYVDPGDFSTLEQAWTSVGHAPKAPLLDWRDVGGINYIPTVEDQGVSGNCWCFASTHLLESRIKIDNYPSMFTDDFSEDAVADCTYPGGSAVGGNFFRSGGYFSAMGPVLESCQGWDPGSTNCLSCPQQNYRLKKMITIAETTTAIKAALANGPVGTAMLTTATSTDFNSYNGTFVLAGSTTSSSDHSVYIVGYHEGTGDPGYLDGDYWICQNSWGPSWGDNGFFYIAYGAAGIGQDPVQFVEWEDSLDSQGKIILYEDESGGDGYITGAATNEYICQELTPTTDGYLTAIQWANHGNNFDWEIRIYDNLSGGTPSILLASKSGTNEPYGGYLEEEFASVPVSNGDPIYVCIRLNNPTGSTQPIDVSGPYSGNAYISNGTITGPYVNNSTYSLNFDWSVRAIITEATPGPTATPTTGVPSTTPAGTGILVIVLGALMLVSLRRR